MSTPKLPHGQNVYPFLLCPMSKPIMVLDSESSKEKSKGHWCGSERIWVKRLRSNSIACSSVERSTPAPSSWARPICANANTSWKWMKDCRVLEKRRSLFLINIPQILHPFPTMLKSRYPFLEPQSTFFETLASPVSFKGPESRNGWCLTVSNTIGWKTRTKNYI